MRNSINYLTGVGFATDDETFAKYWPADVHLVGKDIIKFHCALWPAMLMSAGLELPKKVFAHGFFTIDGDKMSKSLGNVIDPREVAEKYGRDTMRYFLLKEITFGEDGDFSLKRLAERYSGDLANELGNLVHRTLSMTEKYLDGLVPAETQEDIVPTWSEYDKAMESLDFGKALESVWGILRNSNKLIDEKKPWALAKEGKDDELKLVLYVLLERLRHVAWMMKPFMPETSPRIFEQLGIDESSTSYEDAKQWGGLKEGTKIAKGDPLFPRLEE
jgi:methionyl-tRNA synthetase